MCERERQTERKKEEMKWIYVGGNGERVSVKINLSVYVVERKWERKGEREREREKMNFIDVGRNRERKNV